MLGTISEGKTVRCSGFTYQGVGYITTAITNDRMQAWMWAHALDNGEHIRYRGFVIAKFDDCLFYQCGKAGRFFLECLDYERAMDKQDPLWEAIYSIESRPRNKFSCVSYKVRGGEMLVTFCAAKNKKYKPSLRGQSMRHSMRELVN